MAADDVPPLDEKAKRTRDLLASFYSPDPSMASSATSLSPGKTATLDSINSPAFDPAKYMNLLVHKSNLEGLVQKHVEMAAEIKNLDTDLQMLVYENYNKFISATDTIKRMKNNIVGMEANMEQLLEKIVSVQTRSDGVNTSLFEKREHIEKLHRTRNLLRKVQFIYDLPSRLEKCIKSEAYADAVRFFIGAKPIFEAYGGSSFQDCKKASEQTMEIVIQNLQAKLNLDSEPIEARAEAIVLLKQLNFPVDNLKMKLFNRLEDSLSGLQSGFGSRELDTSEMDNKESSKKEKILESIHSELPSSSLASIGEFSKMVRAYRIIFPESENRLIELSQDLFTRNFGTIKHHMKKRMTSTDLLSILRTIWGDITVMDEVLPEAALPIFSFEAARGVIRQYISSRFSFLLHEVSGRLTGGKSKPNEAPEELTLQIALEGSKKAVIQGTMDLLLDFRLLLDNDLEVLLKLRDLIIDWVQEGFQNFFQTLDNHFLMLSGKSSSTNQDAMLVDQMQLDKVPTGIVLVLAQLSLFIEQSAIPRITEEIAASFSGGSIRGYEYGPAFVPGEICRTFHSASEKLIDLLEAIAAEVRQILPSNPVQKHRRSESTGSTNSGRSNPMREDRTNRSNSQRARSQLLESHLAKLFEQKMEIFTKVEFIQESVLSTIVKLCLKSLLEFIRLQTFNRSGYQQIQLDIEYLKSPLKEIAEDEAAIDFLLKEVNNAAHERCLDPIPLEPAIVDKLIQAKINRCKEQNTS